MSGEPTFDDAAAAAARNLRVIPWWWVLRWVWLGEAIWVVYLTEERGLTVGQVLAFDAILAVVVLTAELPTGIVADRYGRRLTLVLAGIVTAPAFLVFGLGTSLLMLLVAYAAFGPGEALASGADSAMLFDSLRAAGRDREFTRWVGLLNGAVTASVAALSLVGALMVRWLPLWTPIVASAVFTLPAIVLALRMHEPPRSNGNAHSFVAIGRLTLSRVLGTSSIWAYMLIWVAGLVSMSTMVVTLPVLLRQEGLPVWALGPFAAVQMALSAAGALLAVPIARRFGLPRTVGVMALLSPASLLAGATGVLALVPLFLLPSVGFNVVYVHGVDFLSRSVPDSQRATVVSIASMAGNVGLVVSAIALGRLADARGVEWALAAGAVVLGALAALGAVVWLRSDDVPAALSPLSD